MSTNAQWRDLAVSMLRQGKSPAEVWEALTSNGMGGGAAEALVRELLELRRQAEAASTPTAHRQIGTIVEYSSGNELGWIELDQGGRVRFGRTSLQDIRTVMIGTRVEVHGTKPGYKGVLKAVAVARLAAPDAAHEPLSSVNDGTTIEGHDAAEQHGLGPGHPPLARYDGREASPSDSSMLATPAEIEKIPGFMDWFAAGDPPPTGKAAAVLDVLGMGCVFSRPLVDSERAEILAFLRAHADRHMTYMLLGVLLAPLAEMTGARIDKVRVVAHEVAIADSFQPHLESTVGLSFGARRDAAEQQCQTLGLRGVDARIVGEGNKIGIVGRLQIPLDRGLTTAAEIQRYLEIARKEIGLVALDTPPMFRAELRMDVPNPAAAEPARAKLAAAGLATELVERVSRDGRFEILGWQYRWLQKSGRVEALLFPGVLSAGGFLGRNERLENVLDEDARTLASLGVTPAAIAARLRDIVGRALERPEYTPNGRSRATVDDFQVTWEQYRGFQECPWGCAHEPQWASIDFVLENRRTGKRLSGPGLIAHLIAEHNFFEGHESPYRVDPREVIEVLEVQPEPVSSRS